MSPKHSNRTFEFPVAAMVCYCVVAICVTFVAAQTRGVSQDEGVAADTKKVEAKSTGNNATDQKIKDAKSPAKKEDSQESSKANSKEEESSKKTPNSLPVVSIKTKASSNPDSLLNFQSGAFDIVVPEWYSEPVVVEEEKNRVGFHVFGFDDQQLQDEVKTQLTKEVDRYVDQLLGTNAHKYVEFSDEEKNKLLAKTETRAGIFFDGQEQLPVDFYFAQLEFDNSFQELAKSKWVQKRQESRLLQYGLIGGGALLLIGFLFGGLKLNTATSGFYQGRLQFFVAIVILGVVAAGIYFGTQIEWI